jgi:hypothetical protein
MLLVHRLKLDLMEKDKPWNFQVRSVKVPKKVEFFTVSDEYDPVSCYVCGKKRIIL